LVLSQWTIALGVQLEDILMPYQAPQKNVNLVHQANITVTITALLLLIVSFVELANGVVPPLLFAPIVQQANT
jgi:hypothetical protein